MTGTICELYIKKEKGHPPVPVSSLAVTRENGITGDIHSGDGERAVCLIAEETKRAVEAQKEQAPCLRKFSCNAVFSGMEPPTPGQRLRIGTAELTVESVGRACHGLCGIPSCPLIRGVIFASVNGSGTIRVGDEVNNA